jgi:hypothetical protein
MKIRKGITPEKPTFEPNFITTSGGHGPSRYRDAVYTPNDKILTMLGVDPTERDKFPTTVDLERKVICDKMLGYLLKRNRFARQEFALDFQKKMVHQLNAKFDRLKNMVDEECSCIAGKGSNTAKRDSLATVRSADPVDKRKLLLQRSMNQNADQGTGQLKSKRPDAGMNLLLQKKGLPSKASSAVHYPDSMSENRKLLMQKTYKTKSLQK